MRLNGLELLVKASSTKTMLIQQFRKTVYQSLRKRADAILDLVDALTVAGHVNSPVALSEETPFRRKFSSIFDTLQQAEIDFDELLLQPCTSTSQPTANRLQDMKCTPWIAHPMNAKKQKRWKIVVR